MHLGIIADGNRRWAKKNGLPKIEGHKRGLERIEELVGAATHEDKVEFLTFYVFSNENWGREEGEVSNIMRLAEKRILKLAEKMKKNNVRLLILGARERVPEKLMAEIDAAEALTTDCDGLTVCFCFNYGGEQEIADAATAAVREGLEITPESIRAHLYHPEVPNVDMVVRTSGEERISGFMLWRVAYAEMLFLEKYFPEMTADDLKIILKEYENRHRRFGK